MDSSKFWTPNPISEEHYKKLMDHVDLTVEEMAANKKKVFFSSDFKSCFDRFVASIGDDAIVTAELWLHMMSVLAEHISSFKSFEFDFYYIPESWFPRSSVIEGFLRSLAKALSSGGNSIASLEEIQISYLGQFDQPARFLQILSGFFQQPYCGVKCLRIFPGSVGNECATLIQGMISNAHSLERLKFRLDYFEYMESEAFEDMYVDIVHALLASESLQSCELWWVPERALTTLAKSLASMNIGFDGDAPAEPLVTPLEMDSGLQGQRVRRKSQLKDVSLTNGMLISQEGIDALAAMLATNNTLKKLEILFREGNRESDMKTIVKGLRSNVCLEVLRLGTFPLSMTLPSELGAEMLSTLESNKTLQRFTFNARCDRVIDHKLARNMIEQQFLEVVAHLERTTSSHIKCFLIGEPEVGKSTLKDSICRGALKHYIDKMKKMAPGDRPAKPRTKGIEMVHVALKGVNIQFWDLGGQPEYHTIHDLFMPTLGGDMAVPPIFLLLFDPVLAYEQVISGISSGNTSAADVEKRQRDELLQRLRYWMRFIVTNCKAERKPCVIPICNPHLTQKQKLCDLDSRADKLVSWISEEFHETLDIVDEVILIDARKNRDAKKVKKFVFSKAKALLHNTNVMQIMERVQTLVVKSSVSTIPLMTWTKFCEICWSGDIASKYQERSLSGVQSGPCQTELYGNPLLKIMASYLHDIGQVIWFEPMPFVITNPQWFCCNFVGELIPTEFHASGVFNGIADVDLLERVLSEAVSGKCEVGVEDIVNLMLRMELAYKVCDDPKSSLLMPSCLPDRQDGDMISWKVRRKNGHEQEGHFFGYRIECKDKKQTMLTAEFFHRLQVRFHEKFHAEGNYSCQKDLSEIFYNGYEIYVEFGGIHDDWIDVMVSSPEVSVAEAAEWVDENILRAINQLCREPTGLPGVDLVTKILRPGCLTASAIVPRRYRSDHQTVTEDKLIEGMTREEYRYFHSWPAIWDGQGQEIVSRSCDDALVLIRPKTLECHLSVQKRELHRVCESFDVLGGNLERRWCEYGHKNGTGHFGAYSEASFECEQPTTTVEELGDLLKRGIQHLDEKANRIFRSINELKEEVKNLRQVQTDAFARLNSALSSISVFATQLHTLELHLMCESKDRSHVVDGQKGKELFLQNKESRYAWTLFRWTILALTVLLKTGCAISMGIHELVPDLGDVTNWTSFVIGAVGNAGLEFVNVEDLERRMNAIGKDMFKYDGPEDGVNRQQAMDWLERNLEGGPSEIRERFGLTRVKYRDTGAVAWICSSCLTKTGLRAEVF
ncbi:hypothetical protein CBR_g38597 [Chara braunii]|uniref:Uncharacterized protein n=1 Tax=Chara braunii TaxID=69332 RepID=A0A388K0F2_CHABU|nr:hypothetical protein CBR_g38597 [Chara braunii]|eukprot:GBG63529.1 hypothetical protein CBR_g38597 [Chara braunii]